MPTVDRELRMPAITFRDVGMEALTRLLSPMYRVHGTLSWCAVSYATPALFEPVLEPE
jgi:hypothetical protein